MKKLLIRSLTGLVYVGVILLGLSPFFPPYSFLFVFVLLLCLTLGEFYSLMDEQYVKEDLALVLNTLGGVLLFIAFFACASGCDTKILPSIYFLYLLAVFVMGLYESGSDPIRTLGCVVLGQFWIALPFGLLCLLVYPFGAAAGFDTRYLLAVFVFLWVNDTGAYLSGSTFGRHHLAPAISPKKTWEGSIGGFVLTLAVSFFFAHYGKGEVWGFWLGLAAISAIFGTLGDLCESKFKRSLGIKDSGRILPGHGGMLDRFDSLLLAAPAAYIYIDFYFNL